MEKQIEFSKNLIKGRIAEVIFEQMFRQSGKFTILRSGYEYTFPELAQYQQLPKVENFLNKIKHNIDFILISDDKKEVYLVEVKYRSTMIADEIKKTALDTKKIQNPSWLFIASPTGFFFEPCNTIIKNEGKIGQLRETWVVKEIQDQFLGLMNEFKPAKN